MPAKSRKHGKTGKETKSFFLTFSTFCPESPGMPVQENDLEL
jgi:hypothetical protein